MALKLELDDPWCTREQSYFSCFSCKYFSGNLECTNIRDCNWYDKEGYEPRK